VPDSEADIFMGHKSEGGATNKRYIPGRPEYLKGVAKGVDLLYAALAEFVERPFAERGMGRSTEPRFATRCASTAWQVIRLTYVTI
jgi:hypothetical protein